MFPGCADAEMAAGRALDADGPGVDVTLVRASMRVVKGGALLAWLGPALRGVVARSMKEMHCRHTPEEREGRWRYCAGCPHGDVCPYGRLFEPAESPQQSLGSGFRDGQRGAVLCVEFPAPANAARGEQLRLELKTIGRAGGNDSAELLRAVAVAGAQNGIGPDRVKFELDEAKAATIRLRPADLPGLPTGRPVLPRLGLTLTAPLFMRSAEEDQRRAVTRPAFAAIFSAAMRTVSRTLRTGGAPLEADWRGLLDLAQAVREADADWQPFRQRRWSNRTEMRFEVVGCTGSAVYADVPLCLVPWLHWGGVIHVGMHRVSGAGGWRVWLD